ncbi:uncharacterized protein LOC144364032 [Saccoglossus kowalevskii]
MKWYMVIVLVAFMSVSINLLLHWQVKSLISVRHSAYRASPRENDVYDSDISVAAENVSKFNLFSEEDQILEYGTTAVQMGQANTRRRYLLPVLRYGGGGTNSQFKHFENAAILSLVTNRTIALTPFFLNGGHVRGFTRETLRDFNKTFNVAKLAQLMPVSEIKDFQNDCENRRINVITWDGDEDAYKLTRRELFRKLLAIRLPRHAAVHVLDGERNSDELSRILGDEPCVALYRPHDFNLTEHEYEKQRQIVHSHLVRTDFVKNVTDVIIQKMCDGKPYLAFHWRNKTTEYPCIFQMRKGLKPNESVSFSCEAKKSEVLLMADKVAENIADIMQKKKIECVYVATLTWSQTIVEHLAKRIPRNKIYISDNITAGDDLSVLRDDLYTMSLVEQEICFRAEIFIASCASHWSQFVMADRDGVGKTTDCTSELPGMKNLPIRNQIIKAS